MMVHTFVTNNCNLSCEYCYVASLKEYKDFSINNIDALINFINKALSLNKSKRLLFDFFGGEPLLNKELIERIISASKNKISLAPDYFMTTNGTLLTKENIDFLSDNNIKLSVSLDGDPNTHNKYRKLSNGKSSWDKIENNLEYLLTKIPDVTARMTFNSCTISKLFENIRFLSDIGFKMIKPVPNFFDNDWNEDSFEILTEQFNKVNDFLQINNDIEILLFKKQLAIQCDCSGGFDSFSIDVNGDIYPCNFVVGTSEFCLGNINNIDSFQIRTFQTDNSKREECLGCAYFKTCESARCIFVNYRMTNDLYKPNGFFCAYERFLSSFVKT